MEITTHTAFDPSKQEEVYETINIDEKQAKEVIETLLSRLDYKQAKAWIEAHR
jgi:predicted transcriptional regulator